MRRGSGQTSSRLRLRARPCEGSNEGAANPLVALAGAGLIRNSRLPRFPFSSRKKLTMDYGCNCGGITATPAGLRQMSADERRKFWDEVRNCLTCKYDRKNSV